MSRPNVMFVLLNCYVMEDQVSQKLSRKAARLIVNKALSSLTDLEQSLGEKKFRRRLEKAELILSKGLPKSEKENKFPKDKKEKKLRAEKVA